MPIPNAGLMLAGPGPCQHYVFIRLIVLFKTIKKGLMPIVSALLMGKLHKYMRRRANNLLLSQPQLFVVQNFVFCNRFMVVVSLATAFEGRFLRAEGKLLHQKVLLNLDSQSPLTLISHLASSLVVVDLRANVSR